LPPFDVGGTLWSRVQLRGAAAKAESQPLPPRPLMPWSIDECGQLQLSSFARPAVDRDAAVAHKVGASVRTGERVQYAQQLGAMGRSSIGRGLLCRLKAVQAVVVSYPLAEVRPKCVLRGRHLREVERVQREAHAEEERLGGQLDDCGSKFVRVGSLKFVARLVAATRPVP